MKSRLVLTLLVVILTTSFVFSQAAKTTDTPKDPKQKSESPAGKTEKSAAKMDCSKMAKTEKKQAHEDCTDMKEQKASADDCAKACADIDHSKESKAECEKTCSDKVKMKEAKHDCTGKECSHASHSDPKDCDSKK